jgi:hypothetical protein
MKARVIPKLGDVVEIKTPKGLRYVQYSAKHTSHPVFGELVRVLPGLYDSRPADLPTLVLEKEDYFVFTPIGLACRRKWATIVSNDAVPGWAEGIPVMRMPNSIDDQGKGHDWYLWNGNDTWCAAGVDLARISIASIWGHDVLVERLAEGWLPADDAGLGVQPRSTDQAR